MNAQRIPSIELSAADETTKRNFEKTHSQNRKSAQHAARYGSIAFRAGRVDVSSRGAGEGSFD